ncbi:MAG: DNA-processing protein DprA [Wenzhouxiangellaceae bacterium]
MPASGRDDPEGWLRLLLARGLGPASISGWRVERQRLGELYGLSRRELSELGLTGRQIDAIEQVDPALLDRCRDWLAQPGHHLITLADPLYPPLLARIDDPPPALFVHGDPGVLSHPQIAVVGSRNATAGGLEIAAEFAGRLARAGLTITSGLAAGVDTAAHRAALEAGQTTIAVAGTGPDRVYPARNRDLARRIVQQGAVVSIFAPGVEPRPGHFPARNRIISGMSLGVVVVEAGIRSGSLITARLAGEQGREVFAVPGSIRNPLARGCHHLIRQGARLVESADEVLEELAPLAGELAEAIRLKLDEPDEAGERLPDPESPEGQLLAAIGYDPVSADRLAERTGLDAGTVAGLLLELELAGLVQTVPGGLYTRS